MLVYVVFQGGSGYNTFIDQGIGRAAVAIGGNMITPTDGSIVNNFQVGPRPPQSVVLVGGTGNNFLQNTGSGSTFIVGGHGNDQLYGGTGADTIIGHGSYTPSNQLVGLVDLIQSDHGRQLDDRYACDHL